jgi:hypothetical protein
MAAFKWATISPADPSQRPSHELHVVGLHRSDRRTRREPPPVLSAKVTAITPPRPSTNSKKTELIRHQGPWRTVQQVELSTLEWVWWFNNQRLHSELCYCTPAEVQGAYQADLDTPAGGNRRPCKTLGTKPSAIQRVD